MALREKSALKPTVSIGLPVFNGASFLAKAIESALAQSFDDFELLISDDCSTDGSQEIIQRYASQNQRIVSWRNETRLGLFANYNKCLQRASGTFIKPFAQDDLWAPQLLEKQVAILNAQSQVSLVSARRVRIDENGVPLAVQSATVADILGDRPFYLADDVTKACLTHYLDNLIGEPCSVMFRKRSQGDGFRTSFRHIGDLEYWLRILKDGHYGFVNEPLAFFRHHAGAATATNTSQLWSLSEVVQFAELVSEDLTRIGSSKELFVKQSLMLAANFLPTLETGEPDLTGLNKEDSANNSDVLALKQSLIYALSTISELKQTAYSRANSASRQVAHNELKIKHKEQVLATLLSSASWRLTRGLRDLNKLIARKEEETFEFPDEPIGLSAIEKQRWYLSSMDKVMQKILHSRSWAVTVPLRSILQIDKHPDFVKTLPTADIAPIAEHSRPAPAAGKLLPALSHQPIFANTTVAKNDIAGLSRDVSVHFSQAREVSERPYDIILVCHEATRTGAPLVGHALAKKFRLRGLNCLVVLKQGGEIADDFLQLADVLNLSESEDPQQTLDDALNQLARAGRLMPNTITFANSAAVAELCHIFKHHNLRVVSLVHEFMSSLPFAERAALVSNSETCVFSSQATLDDALKSYTFTAKTALIPQGLLDAKFGTLSRAVGKEFLRTEYGIGPNSFVVLACGTTSQRKGIDIFTQAACHILADAAGRPDIHFIWIGGEEPAIYDALWWAQKDVKSIGIEKNVHFVGAQKNIERFFVGADVFVLPSREDPLPCAVQQAQAAGLPVVAFKNSGGTEEILSHGGGTMVAYGNSIAMSQAILDYHKYRTLCTAHGLAGKAAMASKYKMTDYVDKLLRLAGLLSPAVAEAPHIVHQEPDHKGHSRLPAPGRARATA